MSKIKRRFLTAAAASVLLSAACVMPAFAQQSPEFARTPEEWASLRDDVLEYGEIEALIHEYNVTVLKNAASFRSEEKQSSSDIAQSYYDAAEKTISSLADEDPDAGNYAGAVSGNLNKQIQYENLMKQGDTNTNDTETKKLGYEKTEMQLVKQAQEQMISYWSQLNSLSGSEANLRSAQQAYETALNRQAAGTGTAADVSSAQSRVTSSQASLDSARSSLASARSSLIMMMGWSYDADVDIRPLPEVSEAEIAAIDLAADIAAAKENNISLKTIRRQYENAHHAPTKENLGRDKESAERAIENNVNSLYNALILAQSSYAQAAASRANQNAALETAGRKLKAGLITQKSYDQTAASLTGSDSSLEGKKLDLLKAYNAYKWAVRGLAST